MEQFLVEYKQRKKFVKINKIKIENNRSERYCDTFKVTP